MKKIYIAGAYSDNNVMGVLRNIGRGQYYAQFLFKKGYAPFTPWHDSTFVIDNWRRKIDVEMFYEYSLSWLIVSDALFVVPNRPGLKNWQDSKGTRNEIELANRFSIPVFYTLKDLINNV